MLFTQKTILYKTQFSSMKKRYHGHDLLASSLKYFSQLITVNKCHVIFKTVFVICQ